jgi:predicted dinucleotide-binding enzyme
MRIGIIGSGRIGGNAARLFARAGHELLLSFSRDRDKLERLPPRSAPASARRARRHGSATW